MKNKIQITVLAILIVGQTFSQTHRNKIKVYLLGTFHFTQTDTTINDVRSAKNQQSIQQLSDIIYKLSPDKIFIERMPEWEYENHMDSLYQEYRKGKLRQARNEIWQVAGRTANRLNHQHLFQADNPGNYSFHYSRLEEYAKANNQEDKLLFKGKGMTQALTSKINYDSLRDHSNLLEFIRWLNSKEVQESSHAQYINVYPQIGNTNAFTPANKIDSSYFIGANLTIDWYRRNIMIYSKMLSQLDYNEKSIFLIIGNDHIAIIRQMFQENPFFEVIDTEKWLGKNNFKFSENLH
ncbi:MAG: DUF5694 domain-containing protein [Sphingobacteriia bacterium]|jgi:hypothetical protein